MSRISTVSRRKDLVDPLPRQARLPVQAGSGARQLLTQYGCQFAETPSKPVLVLPVYRDRPGPCCCGIRTESLARGLGIPCRRPTGLVPMLLPLGDLTDIAAIGAEQAGAGRRSAQRLAAVAQRYGDRRFAGRAGKPFHRSADRRSAMTLQVTISRYGTFGRRADPACAPSPPPRARRRRTLLSSVPPATSRSRSRTAGSRDNLLQFLGIRRSWRCRFPSASSATGWWIRKSSLPTSPSSAIPNWFCCRVPRCGSIFTSSAAEEQLILALEQARALTTEPGSLGHWILRSIRPVAEDPRY